MPLSTAPSHETDIRAFADWVKYWNNKGYAALALDTEGHVPVKVEQGENVKRKPGASQWQTIESLNRGSTGQPARDWGPKTAAGYADGELPPEEQWLYHAGRLKPEDLSGMPTEELSHLASDRIEMVNVASDAQFASQLASARAAFDAELAAMKTQVIQGHSYEAHPVLFDRTTLWESKEPLLIKIIGNVASEGGSSDAKTDGRRKAKREGVY